MPSPIEPETVRCRESALGPFAPCCSLPSHGLRFALWWSRKKASKAELKKIKKNIAEKRKQGIECYTDEEIEAAGFLPQE